MKTRAPRNSSELASGHGAARGLSLTAQSTAGVVAKYGDVDGVVDVPPVWFPATKAHKREKNARAYACYM